jgi:hypothetical protein
VLTQAIELSMSTPYIDFHFNGSTADYRTPYPDGRTAEFRMGF